MTEAQLLNEILRFNRAYDLLFELIEDTPSEWGETPGACGAWSPKQVLAHLDGWVAEANRQFDALDGGGQAAHIPEENAFNAQSVQTRALLAWDEQIAHLLAAVDTMSVRVSALPLEVWMQQSGYWQWFNELAEDCEEHAEQLWIFMRRQ